MNTLTLCRAGLIALTLGVASVGSTQAAQITADFRLNFNSSMSSKSCFTNKQIVRGLRNNGYSNVSIVRDLGRQRVLALGNYKGKWYQMRVDACTGRVDNIRRVFRNNRGDFSFYLDFGNDGRGPRGGYDNGGYDHDGYDDGYGDNGPGHGPGNGPGRGPGNGGPNGNDDDQLVCLVTFFDASQVAAGRDADVQSARLMTLRQAQEIDRPDDRRRIFDYGTDDQNRQTCDYLNGLDN